MLGWVLLEQNDIQRADALLRQILAEAQDLGNWTISLTVCTDWPKSR